MDRRKRREVTHGQQWQATDKDFWDDECQDAIFITTDLFDEGERVVVWIETGEYGQFEDDYIRKYCTLVKSEPEPKAGLLDEIEIILRLMLRDKNAKFVVEYYTDRIMDAIQGCDGDE